MVRSGRDAPNAEDVKCILQHLGDDLGTNVGEHVVPDSRGEDPVIKKTGRDDGRSRIVHWYGPC